MTTITVFFRNDDNSDLRVTIIDEFLDGGTTVILKQHLTDGDTIGVSLEATVDGNGVVGWECERIDDSSVTGSDSGIEVFAGQTVEISTGF